jgi:uncharacterized protein with NAD-binding domain and iron-sulfur cluster
MTRVLIMGAGFAGLNAAKILGGSGANFWWLKRLAS